MAHQRDVVRTRSGSHVPPSRAADPAGFLSWSDASMVAAARSAGADVDAALRLARELSPVASALGRSSWTWLRALASLGAGDLTVARVVEPHLDALTILSQAAARDSENDRSWPAFVAPATSTWGVYAAHAPGHHLEARASGGEWTLNGSKPWCSLADHLSHAVITAHVDDDRRQAFAVDLGHPGVRVGTEPWVSRGLAAIRSTSVSLSNVPAVPVGPPQWYLDRPGFAWGGIGVAGVWFGAACALGTSVLEAARRREPDQLALTHLGRIDSALHATLLTLRDAAAAIDDGRATGTAGRLLASRVRASADRTAELVLREVGRALGPGPLTGDEEHARRVADLTVYVRQHHGDRDLAALGGLLLEGPG
ncbi:acyl-CoA hydrolase [Knoellia flava TL1]|uniref:Acyl-CoA dehydrogenase n=2 Tax=Knoellia flava TaxID=913969 RepID=A0A8H9FUK4_9MICO|nr:acyl-CoA dehydrogenase family protein [Knoellia flava]KGN32763.1 acyl-CoA hydrolase [Knoellia flava TL1]GGB87902.1 acyl-CoA dehydrogenase [Knoellia flava]